MIDHATQLLSVVIDHVIQLGKLGNVIYHGTQKLGSAIYPVTLKLGNVIYPVTLKLGSVIYSITQKLGNVIYHDTQDMSPYAEFPVTVQQIICREDAKISGGGLVLKKGRGRVDFPF